MGYHIWTHDGMKLYTFKGLLDHEMSNVGLAHILWLLAELCGKRANDIKVFTGDEHNDAVEMWQGLSKKLRRFAKCDGRTPCTEVAACDLDPTNIYDDSSEEGCPILAEPPDDEID